MGRIIGNTTATPMVVDDKNLTNVTDQGLVNITSRKFVSEEVALVHLNGTINKGQTICDFKASFIDGTIGTKADEYVGDVGVENNEIVLDGGNIALTSHDLPYTCEKDLTFDWAGFRRLSDGEVASGTAVVLIVGSGNKTVTDKIATENYVSEKVGDVEAALDAIIAIQRESVGG